MDSPRSDADRSPCLNCLNFQTFRLQPPHCHFTHLDLTRYWFNHRVGRSTDRLQFAIRQKGLLRCRLVESEVRELRGRSPTGLAETSSLDYGLFVRLRLLSTLSHKNAVTVDYWAVTGTQVRTYTEPFKQLHRRTRSILRIVSVKCQHALDCDRCFLR
jgi:hypothetical protein